MSIYENLQKQIAKRSVKGVLQEVFTTNPIKPTYGYFREDELWDYKLDIPPSSRGNEVAWANIACDVLAFHNNKGGVLFFGIHDKTFQFVGATNVLDTKLFNDKIRKYIGDRFWVSFSREWIQENQRYLGVAIIPPRTVTPLFAMAEGPIVQGKKTLGIGDYCIRLGDETKVLRGSEAYKVASEHRIASNAVYCVDEPNFRVLRPDYRQFTYRKQICEHLKEALASPRTFVTSLTGIGGVGKTALASWITLSAFEQKQFDFIVSVTAKDRGLSTAGIVALTPNLSSLDDLLRAICETTGFTEYLDRGTTDEQSRLVKDNILSQFSGLLLVDNLETVDDPRIITFLETLPLPCRAIVTSRRIRVRVSCQPIDVGTFQEGEAISFLDECARTSGKYFFADMGAVQKLAVVNSCDRIPLVIEWFVGRSKSPEKALVHAQGLANESKHGDELVEFCFRRVFGELSERQRSVLKVLAVIGRPMPIEAISAATLNSIPDIGDDIEELREYSLLERQYDSHYHDVVHSLLPITNTFIYREVTKILGYEEDVRKRLTNWYQAKDISDPVERALMQKVRRGERNPELVYLQVANDLLEGKTPLLAERYFRLGLERNPTNYSLHRAIAEFYRNHKKEIGLAMHHYEQACEHAPKHGRDRGITFRELGLLVKTSGISNANKEAIKHLSEALRADPTDRFARHALGDCYVKLDAYMLAIPVLLPLLDHKNAETRKMTYGLLQECFPRTGDLLGLADLKNRMQKDGVVTRK